MKPDPFHFDTTTIPITQLDLLFDIASQIRVLRKVVLTEFAEKQGIEYDEAIEQFVEEQKETRKKLIEELWLRYNRKELRFPPGVIPPDAIE
jgi:hypothetical protein